MKKIVLTFSFFLVCAVLYLGFSRDLLIKNFTGNFEPYPKIDFILKDVNNKNVEYQLVQNDNGVSKPEAKSKPIVLFFWTKSCSVCKEDLTFLNEIGNNQKFKDVKIVSVASAESLNSMGAFIKKYKSNLNYPVLVDSNNEVAAKYDVYKFPETFLINREGMVFKRFIGAISSNEVREEFINNLTSSI
ncbi:MAG: TlpA family protein disulfide reductase [Oligoflexia bacterium]|nr:TlpA family protein disulfide reductase [Oligoflexia bacterium]